MHTLQEYGWTYRESHQNNRCVRAQPQEHQLDIPRDKLVVITGICGSGKSSLAFDTIYAEGRRKYVESLSAYARQFLEQMQKPAVGDIAGLPPTIAIEQRSASSNPRSTVATTTEIYDYLRLLFARVGTAALLGLRQADHQPALVADRRFDPQQARGDKGPDLRPADSRQKGRAQGHLRIDIQREGFVRVRVDGAIYDLRDIPELDKNKKHSIEAVVDRLVINEGGAHPPGRLGRDGVEAGRWHVVGAVSRSRPLRSPRGRAEHDGKWNESSYSEKFACPEHPEASLEELSPRMFSFNSPYGACKSCDGLGTILEFDPDLIVPDKTQLARKRGD